MACWLKVALAARRAELPSTDKPLDLVRVGGADCESELNRYSGSMGVSSGGTPPARRSCLTRFCRPCGYSHGFCPHVAIPR
jgi:hypothetical protein